MYEAREKPLALAERGRRRRGVGVCRRQPKCHRNRVLDFAPRLSVRRQIGQLFIFHCGAREARWSIPSWLWIVYSLHTPRQRLYGRPTSGKSPHTRVGHSAPWSCATRGLDKSIGASNRSDLPKWHNKTYLIGNRTRLELVRELCAPLSTNPPPNPPVSPVSFSLPNCGAFTVRPVRKFRLLSEPPIECGISSSP